MQYVYTNSFDPPSSGNTSNNNHINQMPTISDSFHVIVLFFQAISLNYFSWLTNIPFLISRNYAISTLGPIPIQVTIMLIIWFSNKTIILNIGRVPVTTQLYQIVYL